MLKIYRDIAAKIVPATITFMLDCRYNACAPGIKEKVVEMAINSSGIRDLEENEHEIGKQNTQKIERKI